LAKAAIHYENSSVRRLGYLLERMGHARQAKALQSFVKQAKTSVLLNPSVKPLIKELLGARRHRGLIRGRSSRIWSSAERCAISSMRRR
jgi:hypothetical protein